MVYYDGTDYLVGGEVLKDLSGFTLKMADAFVDTPMIEKSIYMQWISSMKMPN